MTITLGKGGGWFLYHGQRLERAEQIALLSMLSAKAGVFAVLVGVPFQMKLYIGAAQPVLYTDTYLLMFTAAPKGAFLSVKLTPSLCLFPTWALHWKASLSGCLHLYQLNSFLKTCLNSFWFSVSPEALRPALPEHLRHFLNHFLKAKCPPIIFFLPKEQELPNFQAKCSANSKIVRVKTLEPIPMCFLAWPIHGVTIINCINLLEPNSPRGVSGAPSYKLELWQFALVEASTFVFMISLIITSL